jgi:hypothetical protein
MSEILLDFFEERVSIKKPDIFSELLNQISSKFLLSLEDTKELLLTYKDSNLKNYKIENENDYKIFLQKKISKINLDISQNSSIYKNELQKQEEIVKNKKKLNKLIKIEKEMDKREKEKMKEMNGLINKFGYGANSLIKNIHSIHNGKNMQKQKIRREICMIQKKLDLLEKKEEIEPLKLKTKPKEKKEEKSENDIHKTIICKGCNAKPIIGIRYKCVICPNFEYCENCEKLFGVNHGHPLLKIRNTETTPLYFKCELKNN